MSVVLLIALYVGTRQDAEITRSQLSGSALLLVFGTFEVWAYGHGKRTSIDRYTHDATPGNTAIRTFGLALDLAIIAFALHLFAKNL